MISLWLQTEESKFSHDDELQGKSQGLWSLITGLFFLMTLETTPIRLAYMSHPWWMKWKTELNTQEAWLCY